MAAHAGDSGTVWMGYKKGNVSTDRREQGFRIEGFHGVEASPHIGIEPSFP